MAPFPVAYDVVVLGGGSAGCVLAVPAQRGPGAIRVPHRSRPRLRRVRGRPVAGGPPVRQRARHLPRLGLRGRVVVLAGQGPRRVLRAQRLLRRVGVARGLRPVGRGRERRMVVRRARALPTSRRGDAPRSALTHRGPRPVHARRARRGRRDRPAAARGLRRSPVARRDGADPGQRGGRRSVERRVRLSRSRAGDGRTSRSCPTRSWTGCASRATAPSGRSSASAARSSRSPPISSCWRRAPTARPRSCSAAASGRRRSSRVSRSMSARTSPAWGGTSSTIRGSR